MTPYDPSLLSLNPLSPAVESSYKGTTKYVAASTILANLNQEYVLTRSSMTGSISWECLDCGRCVSRKWTCSFVPYGPGTTLEVLVSRFLPRKRRIHIYTLCGECCDGISEEDQIAFITKGFRSRSTKSLLWKHRTWELCYNNVECERIMNSDNVQLHMFCSVSLSY